MAQASGILVRGITGEDEEEMLASTRSYGGAAEMRTGEIACADPLHCPFLNPTLMSIT
jgi:hypothetical protein